MKRENKKQRKLDAALGNAHREAYLRENPHGLRGVNKTHKNRKKYNRKQNPRPQDEGFAFL